MGALALKIATYDDILDLPPHITGEIIAGELYTMLRPAPVHALASGGISARLTLSMRRGGGPGGGGWWILSEPELHLGADIVVPDIAGWKYEHLPQFPRTAFMTQAPDWACEVLSPGTAHLDRTVKKRVYAQNGVECYWLVDPQARTLEVLQWIQGYWRELGSWAGAAVVRAAPFEELELDLSEWWPPTEG